MRFLKKIVYIIIALLIALCAMITVCAVNPDLSETLSVLLYQKKEEKNIPAEASSTVVDITQISDDSISAEKENGTAENLQESDSLTAVSDRGRSSDDYRPSRESDIEAPENVSGRTGFEPVQGENEQIDEAEERRIQEEYGPGETGDDLVFPEDFYPYYQMLDETGKHLYRQIYANAIALNKAFSPVEAVSITTLKNVFSAVYNDHPELFWLETSYAGKFGGDGKCIQIVLRFNWTADDINSAREAFQQGANEVTAQLQNPGNSYETERQIHDILLEKLEYDLHAEMNQSAYSALVNGKTVCAGYARAFQYLLQQSGIPCYYCTGYAGENHAWNIVRLEDGFYNVDVTWDDTPEGEYDYFNKSDQDYEDTHLRKDMSVHLPACNGQQYRNLEQSGRERALRSLEEAGFTEDGVCRNMSEYLAACSQQMLQTGMGNYAFSSVLDGDSLMRECYHMYQTESYKQQYLEDTMATLGASYCEMSLEVEELQGGRHLITHYVNIE